MILLFASIILFCPRSLFNLSIATNKREIAAGVTPGILLAWPRFAGFTSCNLLKISFERPFTEV